MPEKPRQAPADIQQFIAHTKPLLEAAGYTFILRDSRWLHPEGADASEYRMTEEDIDANVTRVRQYRGGLLMSLNLGQLWVRLRVGGGKESQLKFEVVDSDGQKEIMDHVDAGLLDLMIDKLKVMAARKVKAALAMRRTFGLV